MPRPDFSQRPFDVLHIVEVHDGDTFRLLLDTGFEMAAFPWLRLDGYSCPELSQPGGPEARDATAKLLTDNLATCWVVTFKTPPTYARKLAQQYGDSHRSFARYIADVWLTPTLRLGDALVEQGHAQVGAFEG